MSEDGKTSKAEKAEGEESLLEVWASLPTIGGHFAAVQGLAWEPRAGRFLLSVSSDQTARLHAAWQCSAGKVGILMCRVSLANNRHDNFENNHNNSDNSNNIDNNIL